MGSEASRDKIPEQVTYLNMNQTASMATTSPPVIARLLTSNCGSEADEDTPTGCRVSFWLLRTCPFILVFVGTIGNVLNLLVLSRPGMRAQPTTVYLLFLACSDLTVLWSGLLRSTLLRGWSIDIRNMSAFICATNEFLTFCCGLFSVWVLVAISLERMLLTKFPILSKSMISRRNAVIICIALFLVCFLMTVHLAFGKTLQYEIVEHVVQRCTYSNAGYLRFFQKEWSLILLVFLNILPAILIFCFNAVIIWTMVTQRRRVEPIDDNNRTPMALVRDARSRALTRMIVFIAVYFLITMSPYNIYIYFVSSLPRDVSDERFANIVLGFLIVMYVGVTNYVLNFLFYFGSGPLFKRELHKLWQKVLRKIQRYVFNMPQESTLTETGPRSQRQGSSVSVPQEGTAPETGTRSIRDVPISTNI